MADLGRRRRVVTVGAAAIVLLAAAIGVAVDRGRTSSPAAADASKAEAMHSAASRLPASGAGGATVVGDGAVPADPATAIGALLAVRAAAMRDGDRSAWLAGLDPATTTVATRFRTAQGQVFDRVRTLRPVFWSYQVTGGSALPAQRRAQLGAAAWLADVHLDYQLTAGGPTVQRQQYLTIVRRAGAWRIDTDTDGATSRDVWDLGPIAHGSASRCLVVGALARRAQIAQLAAGCDQAAATVDQAWGSAWPRSTVLTVPNTLDQLAVLLGRTGATTGSGSSRTTGTGTTGTGTTAGADATAGLDATAAVTIGPADGPADEVLITGEAFDELLAIGRQVVLTHELVHVATRATGSRNAPTWLEEGFADYVAYRSTGLSAQEIAGDALDAVRAGRIPAALPSSAEFNAAGTQASSAYGQAWVAVGLIAARARTRARMKSFYQEAAAGPDSATGQAAAVNAAFAQVGLRNTAAFTPLWQAQLRRLAR